MKRKFINEQNKKQEEASKSFLTSLSTSSSNYITFTEPPFCIGKRVTPQPEMKVSMLQWQYRKPENKSVEPTLIKDEITNDFNNGEYYLSNQIIKKRKLNTESDVGILLQNFLADREKSSVLSTSTPPPMNIKLSSSSSSSSSFHRDDTKQLNVKKQLKKKGKIVIDPRTSSILYCNQNSIKENSPDNYETPLLESPLTVTNTTSKL